MLCFSFTQSNGYRPAPLDLSGIELNERCQDLVELLAENTHNVWSKERIKQGWTYGLTEVTVSDAVFRCRYCSSLFTVSRWSITVILLSLQLVELVFFGTECFLFANTYRSRTYLCYLFIFYLIYFFICI